jgi:hypothetical protein
MRTKRLGKEEFSLMFPGFIVVQSIVFAPALAGLALTSVAVRLGINRLANASFGVVLAWFFLVLPHFGIVAPLTRPARVFAALVQWGLIGMIAGRLTVGRSVGRTLIVCSLPAKIGETLFPSEISVEGGEVSGR